MELTLSPAGGDVREPHERKLAHLLTSSCSSPSPPQVVVRVRPMNENEATRGEVTSLRVSDDRRALEVWGGEGGSSRSCVRACMHAPVTLFVEVSARGFCFEGSLI